MKKYLVVHCFTTTFQLSTEHLTFDDEFIICTTNDVIYYVGITSLVRVSRSDSHNLKKKKKTKNLEIFFKIKKTENIVYVFLKEEAIYRARFWNYRKVFLYCKICYLVSPKSVLWNRGRVYTFCEYRCIIISIHN